MGSPIKRTRSGGFQTDEGTLYVSKPFKTKNDKKARAVISFVPRNSTFDPQGTKQPNEFRVSHETLFHLILVFLRLYCCAGLLHAVLDLNVLACSAKLHRLVRKERVSD